MADVIPARMTHGYDGDLVVFLIGMRINKPWRPDLWLPTFNAMPKMLAELSRDPDSGLLGYRMTFGPADRCWCSTGTRTKSCITTQAIGVQPIVQPGPHSIAGRVRLQAQSASGMRPMSWSEPSRSTPACRFPGSLRPHPACRWHGAARPRWSGSACDRPPDDCQPPGAGASGEKWSNGSVAQG